MKLSTLIKLVDLLSFITLLAMLSTGALLEFTLPARSGGASVWGMTRHEWGDWHSMISLVFLALISVHLVLHIKFIKSFIVGKVTQEQAYRIIIGIVGVVILVALAFAPTVSPVSDAPQRGQGQQHNR